MNFNNFKLDGWLKNWLEEDIGSGDITTEAIVPRQAVTTAYVQAKETGILAGGTVAASVFRLLDEGVQTTLLVKDGSPLAKGQIIAEIKGSARAILSGERLALNLLQHLSGIATATSAFVSLVGEYPARIVDTRKTIPGLRLLEKYAVRVGGGYNHRLGLYDAVLIKDNHIKVAGGIKPAIAAARDSISHTCRIEVEVESLTGAAEALAAGADIIMLDNMEPEAMRQAIELIDGRAVTEASGGIDRTTVAAVAATGIDVISVGALTHTIKALDISLDIGEIKK
ncbi:MAG: carboxylating nicotinate-nucleotide diphosphorylase [Selenomonadaceae bacterium]